MGPLTSVRLPPETYWSRCASVWSRCKYSNTHTPNPTKSKRSKKKPSDGFQSVFQPQWGQAAFLQSDLHLKLQRELMHASVLPVNIKNCGFFVSPLLSLFHLMPLSHEILFNVQYLTPLNMDNSFQISVIYAKILSGTMFLSISSRYTEWDALYKFLPSTQTDTTLVPHTDDSKNCNWYKFCEQCRVVAGTQNEMRCISSCHQHKPTLL
jgi:hypothetical protein